MRTTGNRASHPAGWNKSLEASADLWSDAWALATKFVKHRYSVPVHGEGAGRGDGAVLLRGEIP
jgi:hypothetical protein